MTNLVIGQTANLKATVIADAVTGVHTTATVAWSSSAPSVATVTDHGTVNGVSTCTVKAIAAGSATITATGTGTQSDTALMTELVKVTAAPTQTVTKVILERVL